MKKLFEFTLDKEEEVVEEEITHEDDGSTTTKAKKIKKFVPKKFFVRKPSHSMTDEGGLYYGVELAKAVKAGMLTESMLRKRFEEDGGILTPDEEKDYGKLFEDLKTVIEENNALDTEKKETAAQKKKNDKIKEGLAEKKENIISEIQKFEIAKSSLFAQTAENRSRTKTILWWIVKLSYKDDGELSLLWPGDTVEDQVENYADDTEEKTDPFNELLRKKFMYYVSFWFGSRVSNEKEFQALAKQADKEIEKELKEFEG